MSRHRPPARDRRAGFTLVELMGVILIIALLMALAFPAYQSVMRTAKVTQAKTEIASLEAAIADFKSKFGIDPPSRIDFTGSPGSMSASTRSILRQMFPQIRYNDALDTSLTQAGLAGKTLTSGQALTFFLGGVKRATATDIELVGFSNNPANPFAQPPASGGGTRIGPFYEFDGGRLMAGTGGAPTYADVGSKSVSYAYASTAGRGNYVPSDVTAQMAQGPYKQSSATTASYLNPKTYQIIAAGVGGSLGLGGSLAPADLAGKPDDLDNITNFSEGTLSK